VCDKWRWCGNGHISHPLKVPHEYCCFLFAPQAACRQHESPDACRYEGLPLQLVATDVLVFREHHPSVFADRWQPVLIRSVVAKMVAMTLDFDACVTKSSGERPRV
jgi:hypothetical protein